MQITITMQIDEKAKPEVQPTYAMEALAPRALRHMATHIHRARRSGSGTLRREVVMHKSGTITLHHTAPAGAKVVGHIEVQIEGAEHGKA
jgi:hypothetical protein